MMYGRVLLVAAILIVLPLGAFPRDRDEFMETLSEEAIPGTVATSSAKQSSSQGDMQTSPPPPTVVVVAAAIPTPEPLLTPPQLGDIDVGAEYVAPVTDIPGIDEYKEQIMRRISAAAAVAATASEPTSGSPSSDTPPVAAAVAAAAAVPTANGAASNTSEESSLTAGNSVTVIGGAAAPVVVVASSPGEAGTAAVPPTTTTTYTTPTLPASAATATAIPPPPPAAVPTLSSTTTTPQLMVVVEDEDGAVVETESEAEIDRTKSHRTNFAAEAAGAVIMGANPEMKGVSNLLAPEGDSYALSPCEAKKFAVVGLSEDVMVDTLVISNDEKYSSSVQHFRVLGSQKFPASEWVVLGNFTAENKLGAQTYPISVRSWVRFIKVTWLSHYGAEFYCTWTRLRVHGSTMLEDLQVHMFNSEAQVNIAKAQIERQGAAAGAVAAGSNIQVVTPQQQQQQQQQTTATSTPSSSTTTTTASTTPHQEEQTSSSTTNDNNGGVAGEQKTTTTTTTTKIEEDGTTTTTVVTTIVSGDSLPSSSSGSIEGGEVIGSSGDNASETITTTANIPSLDTDKRLNTTSLPHSTEHSSSDKHATTSTTTVAGEPLAAASTSSPSSQQQTANSTTPLSTATDESALDSIPSTSSSTTMAASVTLSPTAEGAGAGGGGGKDLLFNVLSFFNISIGDDTLVNTTSAQVQAEIEELENVADELLGSTATAATILQTDSVQQNHSNSSTVINSSIEVDTDTDRPVLVSSSINTTIASEILTIPNASISTSISSPPSSVSSAPVVTITTTTTSSSSSSSSSSSTILPGSIDVDVNAIASLGTLTSRAARAGATSSTSSSSSSLSSTGNGFVSANVFKALSTRLGDLEIDASVIHTYLSDMHTRYTGAFVSMSRQIETLKGTVNTLRESSSSGASNNNSSANHQNTSLNINGIAGSNTSIYGNPEGNASSSNINRIQNNNSDNAGVSTTSDLLVSGGGGGGDDDDDDDETNNNTESSHIIPGISSSCFNSIHALCASIFPLGDGVSINGSVINVPFLASLLPVAGGGEGDTASPSSPLDDAIHNTETFGALVIIPSSSAAPSEAASINGTAEQLAQSILELQQFLERLEEKHTSLTRLFVRHIRKHAGVALRFNAATGDIIYLNGSTVVVPLDTEDEDEVEEEEEKMVDSNDTNARNLHASPAASSSGQFLHQYREEKQTDSSSSNSSNPLMIETETRLHHQEETLRLLEAEVAILQQNFRFAIFILCVLLLMFVIFALVYTCALVKDQLSSSGSVSSATGRKPVSVTAAAVATSSSSMMIGGGGGAAASINPTTYSSNPTLSAPTY